MKLPKIDSDLRSFNPDQITQDLYSDLKHDLGGYPNTVVSGDHTFNLTDTFLNGLLKKYKTKEDDTREIRAEKSIQMFLDNVHRLDGVASNLGPLLSSLRAKLGSKNGHRPSSGDFFERVLITARHLVGDFCLQNNFDEESFIKGVRSSPGASIGVQYTDTSPRAKWTFPISVTSQAEPILSHYIHADPLLRESLGCLNGETRNPMLSVVAGSKHFNVDKDNEKDRNCGKEPTGNMNAQQAIMDQLVHGLKHHPLFGLDLSVLPEVHQKLAYASSLDRSRATLDCKNASDSILLILVEFLFSANEASIKWLWFLKKFRCDFMEVKGEQHLLPMISTMGNAYTFPLETMFFYVLSLATVHVVKNPHSPTCLVDKALVLDVSVFGDDIIVPTETAGDVIKVLQQCGVEMNVTKSFYDDYPFRESCGADFFAGRDVRPFNIKVPPEGPNGEIAWLYIIFNGLVNRIHNVYGLPFDDILEFKSVRRICFELHRLTAGNVFIVPRHYPDSAGIRMLPEVPYHRLHDYFDSLVEVIVDRQGLCVFPYLKHVFPKERRRFDFLSYALALREGVTTLSVPDMVRHAKAAVEKFHDKDAAERFAKNFNARNSPSLTTKLRVAARWDASYGYSEGLFDLDGLLGLEINQPTYSNLCLSLTIETQDPRNLRVRKAAKTCLDRLVGKRVGPAVMLN
jgi:hypothetical protein